MAIANFYFKVKKDEEDGLVYLSDFITCYQDLFESRDAFEQGDSVYLSIGIKDLPDAELTELSETLSGKIFQLYFTSEKEYLAAKEKKQKSAIRTEKGKPKRNYSEEDKRRTDKIQISFRASAKVSERLEMLCSKFGMNKKQLLSYLILNQAESGIFPDLAKKKTTVTQADLSVELKKAQRLVAIAHFYQDYKDASDYLNSIAYRVNRGEEVDQVVLREIFERYQKAESDLAALPYDAMNKCMPKDVYESKMLQTIYNCAITNPKNIIQLKDNGYSVANVEDIDRAVCFKIYQKFYFGKELTE